MPSPILPSSEFRVRLQALLREASREVLEAWILEAGELRPAREREAFLAVLGKRLKAKVPPKPPKARDLLPEIDGLLEALADGNYYGEEEWDEYGCHDESDDSWAEAMDELFAEALALCKSGNRALGVEAMRRLLCGLALEQEDSVFGGDGSICLLETDLDAATCTYLRTLLAVTQPELWVEALVKGAEALYHLPKDFTLASLGKPQPPPADVATYLEARGPVLGKRFDAWEDWLPEALLAMGGTQALLDYLRRSGFRNAGAVKVFLETALPKRDWHAVAEVAIGAINAPVESTFCQWLMPLGVEALRRTKNPQAALALAERRFRLQADTWSLLAWLSEGDMALWQERLTALMSAPGLPKPAAHGEGRWAFILRPWRDLRVETRAERLPWLSYGGGDRGFALLAAASLEGAMPPKSVVHQAWHEAFRLQPWNRFDDPTFWKEPTPTRTCTDLLAWKQAAEPLSASAKAELRQELGGIAMARARGVLKTNSRKQYPLAARQVAMAMELHELSGELERAKALSTTLLAEFPRHRAFQEDLAKALRRS